MLNKIEPVVKAIEEKAKAIESAANRVLTDLGPMNVSDHIYDDLKRIARVAHEIRWTHEERTD